MQTGGLHSLSGTSAASTSQSEHLPDGHDAQAVRGQGDEPHPQNPHPLRQKVVNRFDVPHDERANCQVSIIETIIKIFATLEEAEISSNGLKVAGRKVSNPLSLNAYSFASQGGVRNVCRVSVAKAANAGRPALMRPPRA